MVWYRECPASVSSLDCVHQSRALHPRLLRYNTILHAKSRTCRLSSISGVELHKLVLRSIVPELSPPKHAHTTIRRGLEGGDRESPERYAIRLPNDISHFERNIVAFIFLTLLAWTSLIQGLRGQVQYAVDTQRVYEGDGWLGTSKCIYERNGRELISLYLQAALLLQ